MRAVPWRVPDGAADRSARSDRRFAAGLRLSRILGQLSRVLHEWRRRSRDRALLATLDERTLRDIGLTRCDVAYEINKPFWRK